MNQYQQAGFDNRTEYLEHLSNLYEIDFEIVLDFAQTAGTAEDFRNLITLIEDYAEENQ